MKAQFVYESLDFERGQDPKSSIGIGEKVHTWDNIKPGYVMVAKQRCGFSRFSIFSSRAKYWWISPDYYLIVNNWKTGKFKQDSYSGFSEHTRRTHILDFYLNYASEKKLTGEDLSPNRNVSSAGGYGKIEEFKKYLRILQPYEIQKVLENEKKGIFEIPLFEKIYENLDFERGSDSGEYKRTLGIGKEALELEELENYAKYENEDPEDTKYRDVIYLENDYDTDSEELMDKILVAINGGKKIASGENVETDQSYQIWITDQGPIAMVDFDYGNSYFTTFRHKNNFRDEG